MSKETRTCPKCSNIVSAKTRFCEFCGHSFNSSTAVKTTYKPEIEESAVQTEEKVPFAEENTVYTCGESEPVSDNEIELIVKKKPDVFKKKFKKLEKTKTGWNWPVFIMSYFLGPVGAALWFLYRKCKKAGFLVLIAALACTVSFSLIFNSLAAPLFSSLGVAAKNYDTVRQEFSEERAKELVAHAQKYMYQGTVLEENATENEKALINSIRTLVKTTENSSFSLVFFNGLFGVINFAFTITISLFADYIYKKTCISKINKIKTDYPDEPMRISKEGGTSVGLVFVGIAIYYVITFAVELVMVFSLIDIIYNF